MCTLLCTLWPRLQTSPPSLALTLTPTLALALTLTLTLILTLTLPYLRVHVAILAAMVCPLG